MKTIAILQSNYIPWKGYFDLINKVDEFIIYDDMQYTKNDWRNRNKIKTPQCSLWLSIPVKVKGKLGQKIRNTEADGHSWTVKHWKSIVQNYCKAGHFKEVAEFFEPLYMTLQNKNLSVINRTFINEVCKYLNIKTKISHSWDYNLIPGKTERLVNICLQAGADHYISGPAAKNYIQKEVFDEAGISLSWMDYTGYPEYRQLYPPFVHGVTVLDLLFNTGKNSPWYIWGWREAETAHENKNNVS